MGNLGVELAQIMMVPPYNMRVKSGFNKIILVKLWSNIDEIWSKSRV